MVIIIPDHPSANMLEVGIVGFLSVASRIDNLITVSMKVETVFF
jgi:hypothetical protein